MPSEPPRDSSSPSHAATTPWRVRSRDLSFLRFLVVGVLSLAADAGALFIFHGVLHIWLPGTLPAHGHEECLATLAGYLRREEKFLLLVDLSRVGLVPIEQRWRQVEWLEEHECALRERVVGTAIIVASPIVRLSLSAILFFKPMPTPLATFAHLAAAETWAAERLQEAGLTQARKGPGKGR